MKFYLQKLVVGFVFGIGLFASFLVMDEIRSVIKKNERLRVHDSEAAEITKRRTANTLDSSKVAVTNVRLIRLARYISVAVQIENGLTEAFASAVIVIKFFDEKGLVGQCQRYLKGLEPKQINELIVQCEDYRSDNFPEKISIETEIENVQKHSFGL